MAEPVMRTKCSEFSAVDDGQSSRTSSEVTGGASIGVGGKGFMLFGVRVLTEGLFRKSVSMNNLAQYEQPQESNNEIVAGYVSDDVVHPSGRIRERKRGVPWSEEEHRAFLLGLQKIGKGDWRGISRNFVKTRTHTQVASHAQKYFIHRNNHSRRRRRSSLFDIYTDPVLGSATEEQMHQENLPHSPTPQEKPNKNAEKIPMSAFPLAMRTIMIPITRKSSMQDLAIGQVNQLNNSPKPLMAIPILPVPPSSKMANLDLNNISNMGTPSLSLNLSILPQSTPAPNQQSPPARQEHGSAFQALPSSFNGSGGDSIISVA